MTENPKLKDMDSENLGSFCETQNLQYQKVKSDSFTVDIIPTSRITLQRNFSRKGSQRGLDKKMDSSDQDNRRDSNPSFVPNSSSPRATLVGDSMPEKPIMVTVGGTNHPIKQQIHHQITITAAATTSGAPTITTPTKSKHADRRSSFKHSSPWTIDPRRILFFFATLSSIGTMILIFFTLTMGKFNGDENTNN